MLEVIATALISHLGKKVIDKFWNSLQAGNAPVVDLTGSMEHTDSHAGRTLIKKEFTVPEYQEYELILGNFYLAPAIRDLILGHEIPLVLIIEETQQQVFLFEADLEEGYEIDLPHGSYSFYAFLVEKDEDDLFDAEIYAIGFPSSVDLSSVGEFPRGKDEDVWNLVDDSPKEITRGGSYILDFVLIDLDELPEFPKYFSALLGEVVEAEVDSQRYDITGAWKLQEVYDYGSTTADAYLAQVGNKLSGLIIIRDILDDGEELVIQEAVSGAVEGANFSLYGTSVRVIKGRYTDYEFDQWVGIIENNNMIIGRSEDLAGTTGEFIMERVLDG